MWLLATFILAGPAARAASSLEDRIASWYRPLTGEMVALSPDRVRIAYTRHERGELAVYLASVERPDRKTRIAVEDDRPVLFSREKAPARLRFMRWVSPTRLVFSPTMRVTGAVPEASIFAVNTDGSGTRRSRRRRQALDTLNVGSHFVTDREMRAHYRTLYDHLVAKQQKRWLRVEPNVPIGLWLRHSQTSPMRTSGATSTA